MQFDSSCAFLSRSVHLLLSDLSHVVRKPVFGVADKVRHKSGCTAAEDGKWLEIGLRNKRDFTIYVAKTKPLSSCAVTTQLICVFVFAYAKSRFSPDAAQ